MCWTTWIERNLSGSGGGDENIVSRWWARLVNIGRSSFIEKKYKINPAIIIKVEPCHNKIRGIEIDRGIILQCDNTLNDNVRDSDRRYDDGNGSNNRRGAWL